MDGWGTSSPNHGCDGVSHMDHLHVFVVAAEAALGMLQQQAGQLHEVVGLSAECIRAATLLLYGLYTSITQGC